MPRGTDRYIKEIKRSYRSTSYVDIVGPTQETFRLTAIDGEVTVDGKGAVRRALTLKCVDTTGQLTPKDAESILTPFGTRLRPYRGVIYDDGTTEVYPLGVFQLAKTTVDDSVGGSPAISIEASDLSRTISRNSFTSVYTVDAGTNVIDAIKGIVELTLPDVEYDTISTSITTSSPQVYDISSDPWSAVTTLATSLGCEAYFNAKGLLVVAPPPDLAALPSPEFTYIEGQGCTMLSLSRVYTDEPGYNGVIVTGESPGDELPPVRGEAWDMEPSSPTYRYGPYGQVPMFVTDQVVTTVEDATAMATSLLNAQLGFSSQLTITAGVNSTYEAGDVIEVSRARSHVSGLYVVDSFNVPLQGSGTQQLTLRQNRSVG
jgi:hypothetical protein